MPAVSPPCGRARPRGPGRAGDWPPEHRRRRAPEPRTVPPAVAPPATWGAWLSSQIGIPSPTVHPAICRPRRGRDRMQSPPQESPAAAPGSSESPPRSLVWRHVRAALAFTRGRRRGIALAIAVAVAAAVVTAVEPLVMRDIFDVLWRRGSARPLIVGVATLCGLVILQQGLSALATWSAWRSRLAVQRTLLDASVGRLHGLPLAFHHGQAAGAVLTRLDRGVQGLSGAFAELAFTVLPALVYLGFALVT